MGAVTDMDEPSGKLGVGFWSVWTAATAASIGGFGAGAFLIDDVMTGTAKSFAMGGLILAFTFAIVALAMAAKLARIKRGWEPAMRAPQRRYIWRFMPAMTGYVIALFVAIGAWKSLQPEGPLLWLIAVAPAIPLLFAVRAIAMLIVEEDDEVMRTRHLYAFVWATCGALGVCSVWGFLDLFDAVPHVELWAVFPIWAVCLFPAQLLAKRQFG